MSKERYRLKNVGFQDGGGGRGAGRGDVIGSYTEFGFRALRKDVDWTLAETAEPLSSY